jgi:hypothetical protein
VENSKISFTATADFLFLLWISFGLASVFYRITFAIYILPPIIHMHHFFFSQVYPLFGYRSPSDDGLPGVCGRSMTGG